jgi:hypothetical protein
MTVRVERLAGRVEWLDVVFKQCCEQAALRELDTVMKLDEALLRRFRRVFARERSGRHRLQRKREYVHGLEEVLREARNREVLGLLALAGRVSLQVQEVRLQISQSALHVYCQHYAGTRTTNGRTVRSVTSASFCASFFSTSLSGCAGDSPSDLGASALDAASSA